MTNYIKVHYQTKWLTQKLKRFTIQTKKVHYRQLCVNCILTFLSHIGQELAGIDEEDESGLHLHLHFHLADNERKDLALHVHHYENEGDEIDDDDDEGNYYYYYYLSNLQPIMETSTGADGPVNAVSDSLTIVEKFAKQDSVEEIKIQNNQGHLNNSISNLMNNRHDRTFKRRTPKTAFGKEKPKTNLNHGPAVKNGGVNENNADKIIDLSAAEKSEPTNVHTEVEYFSTEKEKGLLSTNANHSNKINTNSTPFKKLNSINSGNVINTSSGVNPEIKAVKVANSNIDKVVANDRNSNRVMNGTGGSNQVAGTMNGSEIKTSTDHLKVANKLQAISSPSVNEPSKIKAEPVSKGIKNHSDSNTNETKISPNNRGTKNDENNTNGYTNVATIVTSNRGDNNSTTSNSENTKVTTSVINGQNNKTDVAKTVPSNDDTNINIVVPTNGSKNIARSVPNSSNISENITVKKNENVTTPSPNNNTISNTNVNETLPRNGDNNVTRKIPKTGKNSVTGIVTNNETPGYTNETKTVTNDGNQSVTKSEPNNGNQSLTTSISNNKTGGYNNNSDINSKVAQTLSNNGNTSVTMTASNHANNTTGLVVSNTTDKYINDNSRLTNTINVTKKVPIVANSNNGQLNLTNTDEKFVQVEDLNRHEETSNFKINVNTDHIYVPSVPDPKLKVNQNERKSQNHAKLGINRKQKKPPHNQMVHQNNVRNAKKSVNFDATDSDKQKNRFQWDREHDTIRLVRFEDQQSLPANRSKFQFTLSSSDDDECETLGNDQNAFFDFFNTVNNIHVDKTDSDRMHLHLHVHKPENEPT